MGWSLSKTPVQTAIDKATSEMLLSPDWETNLVICDAVNQKHSLAPAAVDHLRSRIRSNRPRVVLLALTLAETCVKNCGAPMHTAMATQDMMRALVDTATNGPNPEVQERALGLIEAWGTAFDRPEADPSIHLFVDTYRSLKLQGDAQFPPQDVDAFAPVFTPAAREVQPEQCEYQEAPAVVRPEAPPGIRPAARVVRQIVAERRAAQQTDAAVRTDIGLSLEVGALLNSMVQQQAADAELLEELRAQCVEWLGRLCEWLSHEQLDPESNGGLLGAIEELNVALTAYQDQLNARAATAHDQTEVVPVEGPEWATEEQTNDQAMAEAEKQHMINAIMSAADDDCFDHDSLFTNNTHDSSQINEPEQSNENNEFEDLVIQSHQ